MDDIQTVLDIDYTMNIVTDEMRCSNYQKKCNHYIFPQGAAWSFSLLSVFLNELKSFKVDTNNSCRKQKTQKGKAYYYFKFYDDNEHKHFILINVQSDSIIVKASKSWIDTWESIYLRENWIQKMFSVFNNEASKALFRNSYLYSFTKSDFSEILISFICSFKSMKMSPFNEDTMHLFEFHRFFFKDNSRHSVNLKDLLRSYSGYLFLNLSPVNNTHKKLDKLEIEGTKYYILNGTYIAPFASQLVINIEFNGLMLDTT